MRLLTVLLFFPIVLGKVHHANKHLLDEEWDSFKAKYGKAYESLEEEAQRREAWEVNLKSVLEHNRLYHSGHVSYTTGMTAFADMANEEFRQQMLSKVRLTKHRGQNRHAVLSAKDIPDSVDWRIQGCVSPVRDQGQCATASAFSAVGSFEGQNCRANGNLTALSIQEILDCVYSTGACDGGGSPAEAFEWVQSHGLVSDADYPEDQQGGTCRYDPTKPAVHDEGYVAIQSGNETALMTAVALTGPVSVLVDAGQESFQLYTGGVYDDPNCTQHLNHALLVVGYSTTADGKEYYIAKNSWGADWGMGGYILMARNKNNQCGIASAASYPIIN